MKFMHLEVAKCLKLNCDFMSKIEEKYNTPPFPYFLIEFVVCVFLLGGHRGAIS